MHVGDPAHARRFSPWKESTSPTSPMIVRTTPLLTNAEPPTLSTFSTTWAMSSSLASGDMTTTMVFLFSSVPSRAGRAC